MKKSFLISLLGLVQLLLTFTFQIFILNIFGVGNDLDIYYASNTINLIITTISVGAINFAFTPIFVEYYSKKKFNDLKEVGSSLFNVVFIFFFLLALIQWLFAKQIVHLILPGFTEQETLITIKLFRIFAFLSIISISNALLRSLYYTFEKFYATIYYSIIGVLIQFLIVFFYYKKLGLYSLIYGIIGNQMIVFVMLAIPFIKYYHLNIHWSKDLQNSIKNILPLIASSAFSKSNILIDRFFASTLSSGSITLLYYGEHILKIISEFLNKGISLVSLRKFSLYSDDNNSFEKLFYYVNKVIIFICVPLMFGIAFFFNDTLNIIVFSEKLTHEDVNKLYLVILSLLGMFIGGNLNSTLTNVFYAKKLTYLISKTNIITQVYGIILKISMFFVFGFWGLPIAFSITSLTVTIVLYYLYHKKINKLKILSILNYLFKITIISLIAVLIPKLIVVYCINNWILIIVLEWIIFAILFVVISVMFERDISKSIIDQLFKKKSLLTG